MLSIATDGYYSPISVAYRSTGGADGGVPAAPELVVQVGGVGAAVLAPTLTAQGVAGIAPSIASTASLSAMRPSLTVREIRPTVAEEED